MTTQENPKENLTRPTNMSRGRARPRRLGAERTGRLLSLAALLVLLLPAIGALSTSSTSARASARGSKSQAVESARSRSTQSSATDVSFRNTDSKVGYVGSKACESCHASEYRKFLQTPHGQSATAPDSRAELNKLPSEGVTVCQSGGERCYRVFSGKDGPAKDGYFMSQFDRSADGSEVHTEVEKIAFALGTPLIATGYVIQRGDYLFEAPLTYYNVAVEGHVQGWGLSPGYGNDSVGFTRPVVASCLTCHVGRLRPTDAASNRYLSPPFEELSIGCESCHGPGALHVKERRAGLPAQSIDNSIVNPKHLTSQLADETCAYCHELGQARVPLPGRSFQDYRPGVPLLRTQAIFKSKLLLGWNAEEWSDEMATSACYRFSKGALRCSTCHDPHFTPAAAEAPEFYRSKCLTCHQSSSCALPLSERQHTQPIVDNCVACHMPKHVAPKLIKIGARGTSHRITKTDDEAVPPMDTPQTAPDPKTGLILVDADSPDDQRRLPRVVMLSAYQGILARDQSREDLAEHYKTLLEDMKGDQSSALVLSAQAGAELAKNTPEGDRQAIEDLSKAVELDSKFPRDYLLLSELQDRSGDLGAAVKALSIATEKFPYMPAPYEKLAECYMRAGDTAKASDILRRGLVLFPSDKNLLQLAARAGQP
jgi:hypothetical protein